MFRFSTIQLESAGVLNKLVADYLSDKPELRPYHNAAPSPESFSALIRSSPYQDFERQSLSNALSTQAGWVANSSPATIENIRLLREAGTFTITTGHQLCLFTGPLYFIYKIFSAINLAEQLRKEFPDHRFVPVYWMASEDHDFAEVNHFYVNGNRIEWKSDQRGAVGKFSTKTLSSILPRLKEAWGLSENSKYLLGLFEKAYLQHSDLKAATRYLVNELFGEYGIVIIDGDDPSLKKQFTEEFGKDLFTHEYHQQVSATMSELENLGYHSQVHSREINCFYLDKDLRSRIEKKGETFEVVDTELKFPKDGLAGLLRSSPERFSPNVVLRPLYQQKILPNIAYVGGPGELAYWLEFRKMFEGAGIFFPLLIPRSFITVVEKPVMEKINKLDLEVGDFFTDEKNILRKLQVKEGRNYPTEDAKSQMSAIFRKILHEASAVDATLSAHIQAEEHRTLKKLETIEQKINRAIRRKMDNELKSIRYVRNKFAPGGTPQERVENFSGFYLLYGKKFLEQLKKIISPLDQQMIIMYDS